MSSMQRQNPLLKSIDCLPLRVSVRNRWQSQGICTVGDMIRATWGEFRNINGIGKEGADRLEKALKEMKIDMGAYLAQSLDSLVLPEHLRRFFAQSQVFCPIDLKRLSRREIMGFAQTNYLLAMNIIAILEVMGIHMIQKGDRCILGVESLPVPLKNILFQSGVFTEKEALQLTSDQIYAFWGVGPKIGQELEAWIQAQKKAL